MKKIILCIILFCCISNNTYSQAICDSIQFYSDTVYVNQSTDDSIRIRFNYDWTVNPSIAYPSFFVTLSDTTNIIFNQEFLATFLGQQDSVDFEIMYKNPSIPSGYTVAGTFDIHDPNSFPTLICQFPLVIVFTTPLSIENPSSENDFIVYPNPFTDAVNIDFYKSNITELYVSDLFGISKVNLLSPHIQEIDMSSLPNGIYMLTAIDENGDKFSKRIVKHP